MVALITKAGRIPIALSPDGKRVSAEIPHDVHIHAKTFPFKDFTTGEETYYPTVSIVKGMTFILVQLPNLADLEKAAETKNLNSSTYYVEHLDEGWRNGLCTTMYYVSMGEDEEGRKRYRTRMFETMSEDSGTGSASCALACYLTTEDATEGDAKATGGQEVRFGFEQGIEMGKRNEIFVDVTTKENGIDVEKVVLSGEAVMVMEGTLEV